MNYFFKMANKMNENFKHVFKFGHQPIYYSVFFQFSDIVSLATIPRGNQNSKKTSLKNATKLNSESNVAKKFPNFIFKIQRIFPEYCDRIFHFIITFHI